MGRQRSFHQRRPRIATGIEPYLIFITGMGPNRNAGRLLARLPARSCGDAAERFRALRPVPALDRGVRLEAVAARLRPEEGTSGRTWREEAPGVWLYDRSVTAMKIATYVKNRSE